jgi:hypothetical protein
VPWQLINRDGDIVPTADPQLTHDLGLCLPQRDHITYLLKNAGFVAVVLTPHGMQVKFRPQTVADAAFSQMMNWIGDQKPTRLMVSHFADCGWHQKLLRSNTTATRAYLVQLYNDSGRLPASPIAYRARSIDTLPLDCPLRAAVVAWRKARGNAPIAELLVGPIRERYTLVTRTGAAAKFVIAAYGSGLPIFTKAWLATPEAHTLQDQPDHLYAADCARAYNRAIVTRAPVLEDVDAVVCWPGVGPTRRRYRRLILPVGTDQLLGATIEDTNIDLLRRAS